MPGEPLWLPEDRAKLHALWAHRSERCGKCGERRADFFDADGNELKDPPVWPAEAHCPGCELLHDWEHADDAKDRRPGTYPYLAPVDVDDDEDEVDDED